MKKSHILALVALAAILGMGTPALMSALTNPASAEGDQQNDADPNSPAGTIAPTDSEDTEATTPTDDETITSISEIGDFAKLKDKQITGQTLTLNAPITLTADAEVDLNGNTLSLTGNVRTAFNVNGHSLTLKNGTIDSQHDTTTGNAVILITGLPAGAAGETVVTVEDDVTIKTNNTFGIGILPATNTKEAYGVTLNFRGTLEALCGISVNGLVQQETGVPVINLDGATITSSTEVASVADLAIFAAGNAVWNIEDSVITGYTPLGLKAGTFTIKNSTLTATGAHINDVATSTNGMNPNGSVIQIEDNTSYAGQADLTIKSGTFKSEHGPVFAEYPNAANTRSLTNSGLSRLSIENGTFISADNFSIFDNLLPSSVVITAGTFSTSDGLDDYLKEDQTITTDSEGNTIIGATADPTPSNPGNSGNDNNNDNDKTDDQPGSKPEDTKKPSGSSPNTGVIGTIQNAANAVGALGTTIVTGVLVLCGVALAWLAGARRTRSATTRSSKSSKSSSAKARQLRLDRVEVAISAAPKQASRSAAKASRATKKTTKAAAKSSRPASKSTRTTSKPAKSTAKPVKKAIKTSAKTAKKARR